MIIHVSTPLPSGVEQVHIRLEKNEPMSDALSWAWDEGYTVIHMGKKSFLAERPTVSMIADPPPRAYEGAPDPIPDPLITVNDAWGTPVTPDPLGALTRLADMLGLKTQAEDWARTALLRAAWKTMQTAATTATGTTPTPAAPQPVLPFTLNDVAEFAGSVKNSSAVKNAWGTFADAFTTAPVTPTDEELYDEFLTDDGLDNEEPLGKHAKTDN